MKFLVEDDIVTGTASGDIVGVAAGAFAHHDIATLRFDGQAIVDVSQRTSWHIDAAGRRHIHAAAGRTALTCTLTDEIERDDAGGWRVVDPLPRLKQRLKTQIDAEAERQRLRWITPGAGQAMTYARKVEQARAVLAAANPDQTDYPTLAASIGIDGADIVAVANAIMAMDAQWELVGAAIEQARLTAKAAVEAAENEAEAQTVAPEWPEI